VRPDPNSRREADLVFPRARVAVFVDGCFWHGCPEHASWPKANAAWWRSKIEKNRARDSDTDDRLARAGWQVLRVWEHEDPMQAAQRIAEIVANRTNEQQPPTAPGADARTDGCTLASQS
jgi:DNA mismatch endonuclease (patch repair protein)